MKKDIDEVIDASKAALEKTGFSWFVIDSVTPQEEKKQWMVVAVVGISEKKTKTLVIDDETGRILEFR